MHADRTDDRLFVAVRLRQIRLLGSAGVDCGRRQPHIRFLDLPRASRLKISGAGRDKKRQPTQRAGEAGTELAHRVVRRLQRRPPL